MIPTYTVRLFNKKKYLGIAYAEFETAEQAEEVCKLNKTEFKGRPLLIMLHVPMTPENYFGFGRKSLMLLLGKDKDEIEGTIDSKEIGDEPVKSVSPKVKFTPSEDTIYISKIHPATDVEEVRDWLKDYSPGQIYIYRTKSHSKRSSFYMKGKAVSVFAQVKVPEGETLEQVIAKLAAQKLGGKFRFLKPAFIEKLQVVIDASKADESITEDSVTEESSPETREEKIENGEKESEKKETENPAIEKESEKEDIDQDFKKHKPEELSKKQNPEEGSKNQESVKYQEQESRLDTATEPIFSKSAGAAASDPPSEALLEATSNSLDPLPTLATSL